VRSSAVLQNERYAFSPPFPGWQELIFSGFPENFRKFIDLGAQTDTASTSPRY
jgi:hypothetical protein